MRSTGTSSEPHLDAKKREEKVTQRTVSFNTSVVDRTTPQPFPDNAQPNRTFCLVARILVEEKAGEEEIHLVEVGGYEEGIGWSRRGRGDGGTESREALRRRRGEKAVRLDKVVGAVDEHGRRFHPKEGAR